MLLNAGVAYLHTHDFCVRGVRHGKGRERGTERGGWEEGGKRRGTQFAHNYHTCPSMLMMGPPLFP